MPGPATLLPGEDGRIFKGGGGESTVKQLCFKPISIDLNNYENVEAAIEDVRTTLKDTNIPHNGVFIEINNQLQENVLNLFKAYDTEEFLADEEIRAGISEG